MPNKKDFTDKINSISKNDWNRLFVLIGHIEKSSSFGEITGGGKDQNGVFLMPHIISSKLVDDFCDLCYEIGIIINFNWMQWEDGRDLIKNPKSDLSNLSTETLCKLITLIIREDRFSDGSLVSYFENGIILKILYQLRQNINRTE